MRAVVVGAGPAGLRATEVLQAAGCEVVLIEGGHRPGGTVRSVRVPFTGGQVAESGAEWIDSIHVRMLAQLDRFGIERLGAGEQWTTIRRWIHRNGELLGPQQVQAAEPGVHNELDEFDRIVEAAAHGIADPSRPWLHWQVLREPWGRVHPVGEHVADCTGHMEGALESGETVAARIVAAG